MAGMAYLLPPLHDWDWLAKELDDRFQDQCALIDGQMGIYYPGYSMSCVDYDEGICD